MSDLETARDFVRMAVDDTISAQCSPVPYSICFHAQQAAEKYLKAFLAYHGKPIPKTHDLTRLVGACTEIDATLGACTDAAEALRSFGVEIRYRPSKAEADSRCPEAWSAMGSIVETVRAKLPPDVLNH